MKLKHSLRCLTFRFLYYLQRVYAGFLVTAFSSTNQQCYIVYKLICIRVEKGLLLCLIVQQQKQRTICYIKYYSPVLNLTMKQIAHVFRLEIS